MMIMSPMILRGERRGGDERDDGRRKPHASGPMTVTVCIIPPCMW
jgi:hypothetical protein